MRLTALAGIALTMTALATATPALADERVRAPTARELAELGDTLSNPAVQDTVAAVVDRFAAVLLDTRVGPLTRYADPRDGVRADDTLGQVIERRDPAFADTLHEQTRQIVRGAGRAAGDTATLSVELQRVGERLRTLVEQTAR